MTASLFSAGSDQPIHLIGQSLNLSEWPQFCDDSVTSADVRLSVGQEYGWSHELSRVSFMAAAGVATAFVANRELLR
jgi:hypothetical protein